MLYLHQTKSRLALKLFRGEPAISGFDWNFSPIRTSSPFEENQLSPGSIGISPLSAPHHHLFQQMCVRTSIAPYGNFILDVDRSPGFGSTIRDHKRAFNARFHFGSIPIST